MAKLRKSNQFSNEEVARQLRTNIEYMQIDENFQIINITSANKNEGKSTVIASLAKMYAMKYPKVLLIDCDLRNPSVHKHFNISNSKGLTNILARLKSGMDLEYAMEIRQINFDSNHQISIITAGNRVPNPAEVLESKRFALFLEMTRKYYDFIFIDCPPVGLVSDAIPISRLSDGTLFVVSSLENHKKMVKDCVMVLQRAGCNLLGIVMNKVDISTKKYGHYYGYYGDYGNDGE